MQSRSRHHVSRQTARLSSFKLTERPRIIFEVGCEFDKMLSGAGIEASSRAGLCCWVGGVGSRTDDSWRFNSAVRPNHRRWICSSGRRLFSSQNASFSVLKQFTMTAVLAEFEDSSIEEISLVLLGRFQGRNLDRLERVGLSLRFEI